MMRTDYNNNNPKMIYFQNPDGVKIYVTHFLHDKAIATCKCYRKI